MKIKHIVIRDFKGIDSFESKLYHNTRILGDNGTGKTTILDAIYYCFFGKNIEDETAFSVIPLKEDGAEKKGASPYVAILVEFDSGDEHLIERSVSGGKTSIRIDEMDKTVSEYEDFLSSNIISYDKFRMFFNPKYFVGLHWEKARAEFLKYFKKPAVKDIVSNVKNYNLNPEVEKLLKSATAKEIADNMRKNANAVLKDKEAIEAKIDEIDEMLDKFPKEDKKTLNHKIAELRAKADDYNREAGKYNDYLRKKQSLENELSHYRQRLSDLVNIATDNKQNRISYLEHAYQEGSFKLKEYREEWTKLSADKKATGSCPYCGAALSKEQLAKAHEGIDLKIAENVRKGKELSATILQYQNEAETLRKELKEKSSPNEQKIIATEQLIKETEKSLSELLSQKTLPPVPITDTLDSLEELGRQIGAFDDIEKLKEKRSGYIEQQKELSEKYEYYLELEDNAKRYIAAEAFYIANAVNKQFKNIKIELFHMQKNGIVKDTFVIKLHGVPYKDLNRAGKIIAGLEIQRYFKQYTKNKIPVLIDDFESYPSIDVQEYINGEQTIISHVVAGMKEVEVKDNKKELENE